jgi:hypothetical protein
MTSVLSLADLRSPRDRQKSSAQNGWQRRAFQGSNAVRIRIESTEIAFAGIGLLWYTLSIQMQPCLNQPDCEKDQFK